MDNGRERRVYPQRADFTFYGGLYREVNLILVGEDHFELEKEGSLGLFCTPWVDLKRGQAQVKLEAFTRGGSQVLWEVETEQGLISSLAQIQEGYAATTLYIPKVHLWDGPEDPYLYRVKGKLLKEGQVVDQVELPFGCRSFSIDPEKGFFLNGRSYPLRGVSRHQDREGIGNALRACHHREDMELIREIGANTVRLAHYQHSQTFYDLCDQNGILVWAEIPYITAHMEEGRENTLSQMRELIFQCHHHPSIVCWGLSNEITAGGEVSEDLLENHRQLNDLCHRLDPTRPTTMAHAFMLEQDSPLIEIADLGSYNLYFGWYLGELSQNEEFFDRYHREHPHRVIGFSEYGADANPALHEDAPQRGDYSEEYQCLYHEHLLSCIEQRPYLWATYVWNLFDFAADGREEGGKRGVNQKGLITMDRRIKKDAFYLYKAAWSREPFVHLCGSRYVERVGEVTQVKVYSNQPRVILSVDGKVLAEQEGKRIFIFQVPLSGEHQIQARAGDCQDEMRLCRVKEPKASYHLSQREVVNWFDREEIEKNCFSIRDTLGELMAHPQAGPLVEQLMDQLRASRGEVAQSTAGNKNLERMLAGMRLESLLKQAGNVPEETVKGLNAALQKIKKKEGKAVPPSFRP